MSRLQQIEQTARQVAEAIASVLNVEVTVADGELRRIAGTGRFACSVGERLAPNSAFAQVLSGGRGYIIANPGQDSACAGCGAKGQCGELAQVCCPIRLDGAVIGVVALAAFDADQRATLLEHQHDLFGFIDRMADLLSSKAAEAERLAQLRVVKNQLETVINTVSEGIIAVDRAGRTVKINASARQMLGLGGEEALGLPTDALLPGLPLDEVLNAAREIANREIFRKGPGRRQHFLVSARP